MVEVLVATVVLLITMLPMGILLTSATSAAVDARQRQAALQLADSWIEILSNSQPPINTTDGSVLTSGPATTPTAPLGTQTPPTQLAGTTYAVTAKYGEALVNNLGQSDLCNAGQPPSPTHPGVIDLKVTVTWGNNGAHTLSESTEINYPKPGLQTEGFLAINLPTTTANISDVWGNLGTDRLQAIPITVTQLSGSPVLSPNPYKLYADANGCAFAQVPVGTYTIAVLQPTAGNPPTFGGYPGTPPFVTTSGSPTEQVSSQQVTVTAEQVVQLGAFDEGITAGVSYGGTSAVDRGVQCPEAAGLPCVTTGDGPTGASAAWGGAGSAWSTAALGTGSHVNQVACTTAASPECVGVGYGSGVGTIVSTTSNFSALTSDTVPAGVTDVTQVTCPGNQGCYALGLSSAGPVLLAGRVGPGADTWKVVTPGGISFTSMNSIACPTATTCELSYTGSGSAPGILRLDGDPAPIALAPFLLPVVTADTLVGTISSVGTVTCPTATTCITTATGDLASPADATLATATIGGFGASSWSNESTFPTGATSVTGLSCTATTCLAIGTATGTAAVWTGDLTSSTHNWVQANGIPNLNGNPNTVAAATNVACGSPAPGDTADCAVTVVTPTQTSSGLILEGSLTNGSWAWNFAAPPSSASIQYYVDIACGNPATPGGSVCAAVGATAAGPVVITSGNGTSGNWSNQTPTALNGAAVIGIPLQVAPASTTSWATQVVAGHPSNATTLPSVLYPQPSGYSVSAGDCPAEASNSSTATLSAAPGGLATATIPLGLLPVELVNASGVPVSGATVTLTSTSCPGADSYNMPVTDAQGLTQTSVPYGSYSYTVTIGGVAKAHTDVTMTVGAISVQYTSPALTQLYYLPGLVLVPA
jgi:hypothetical protein